MIHELRDKKSCDDRALITTNCSKWLDDDKLAVSGHTKEMPMTPLPSLEPASQFKMCTAKKFGIQSNEALT